MASTATEVGRLELMADGENDNLWGEKTNENIDSLSRMTGGYIAVPLSGTSVSLLSVDFSTGDHHNHYFKLTGVLSQNCDLILPTVKKSFLVENATTGAFAVEVTTLAGTGVVVPQGQRAFLQCDGTDVIGIVLQAYNPNLTAISGAATVGIPARKSDGTWNQRTITGTADQITVTNGSGADGNPTLSLSSALVLPGTVRSAGGYLVETGGLTIQGGGLSVQQGNARISGANATLTVASNSGFGGLEVSGPSGATIDLKNSEGEDFDVRFFTDGSNGGLTTSTGGINLSVPFGKGVNFFANSTQVGAFVDGGLGVYTGLIDLVVSGNNDSHIQYRNSVRTWDIGVRGGGGWSLRDNGADRLICNPDGGFTLSNGSMTVVNGGLSLSGGVTASSATINGAINAMSLLADSSNQQFFMRGGGFGIDAGTPQQKLHIGNLGNRLNSLMRVESGGPLGFRTWDAGTIYGDFNYVVNDATGGVRRLTISWQTGVTTLNGGLTVTSGSTNIQTPLTVTGASILNGTLATSKPGSGNCLTIINPSNTNSDGCQVQYNGAQANVWTRVRQEAGAALGQFEFINSPYTSPTFIITQDGRALNPSGVYAAISDGRLKENIAPAGDYLDALCQLEVIDYSLIQDARAEANRIGFVAQQVEGVLPRLVDETEWLGDIRKTINSSDIVPMLVRSVQELNARLAKVENA